MSKECRQDARNTFEELLRMNVVPIVNENDAISVEEETYGNFGDNDTMAAHVARLVEADLLILMSDIEGLYTDDPRKNPNARFVHTVRYIDEKLERMGKGAGSAMGTGGMATKIEAAKVATKSGADMVIANGANICAINDIMEEEDWNIVYGREGKREENHMKYMEQIGMRSKAASRSIGLLGQNRRNEALKQAAKELKKQAAFLLEENQKDIANAREKGMKESLIDRLMLTRERIAGIADGLLQIADLEDPIGIVTDMKVRPNGLRIGKKRVPLGVVGII